jgi:hypothetical protein
MNTARREDPPSPPPARKPYAPPTVLYADDLQFETALQCISSKTVVPCAPAGCAAFQAS